MPDQRSHKVSPVLALSAKTSSLPVTMYMIPSLTSGVASPEYCAEPRALEAGHPGSFQLLDIGGVDLLQRRITLIGQITPSGDPILADRALQQTIDFRIGSPDRRCSRQY